MKCNQKGEMLMYMYICCAFVGLNSELYMMHAVYIKVCNFHFQDFKIGKCLR